MFIPRFLSLLWDLRVCWKLQPKCRSTHLWRTWCAPMPSRHLSNPRLVMIETAGKRSGEYHTIVSVLCFDACAFFRRMSQPRRRSWQHRLLCRNHLVSTRHCTQACRTWVWIQSQTLSRSIWWLLLKCKLHWYGCCPREPHKISLMMFSGRNNRFWSSSNLGTYWSLMACSPTYSYLFKHAVRGMLPTLRNHNHAVLSQ